MYNPNKAELTYILANLSKKDNELCDDLAIKTAAKKKRFIEYLNVCREQNKTEKPFKLAVDPREAKMVAHEPLTREQELALENTSRSLLNEGLILYDPNPNPK